MEENKEVSQSEQKPAGKWEKTKEVYAKVRRVLCIVGKVLFHLRKLFLAIPVVWAAFKMFDYGKENLPEEVGVLLQESGEYLYTLDQRTALMSCMAVTGACLVLMFCSRRTIYPWIISIFTLILPIFLVLTNLYPS